MSWITDEQAWLSVTQEIIDFCRRIGRVQGQENSPGSDTSQIKQNGIRRFLDLHGDTITGRDPQLDKNIGHLRRNSFYLAISDLAPINRLDE